MKSFKRIVLCLIALMLTLCVVMGMTPQKNTKVAVETVVLSPGNTAPIAENIQISTYRDTIITGVLKAYDAENENIIFEITKKPKYGEVTLYDDGSFLFDPCGTKRSKVTFNYIAADASGNRSEEATVTIIIEKRSTKVDYTDMEDDVGAYASLYLAENEIYTGECIGSEYFFKPEATVTKAEFLSMCLKATEHELLTGVVRTGLENDEELPYWVKECVSTAVLCGCFTDNEVFEYNETITYEEAAVMINEVFVITDVVSVSSITPYLREESSQAMNNLYFCDIADESIISKFDEPLIMRDAAEMLTAAAKIYNNR